MTMTHTSRLDELAEKYIASKRADEQQALDGARERAAIVVEMLELAGSARPVADRLKITVARVGKIVAGTRK